MLVVKQAVIIDNKQLKIVVDKVREDTGDPIILSILYLKNMEKVDGKALAVTAIKNEINGDEYVTTEEVANKIIYLKSMYDNDELFNELMMEPVERLMNLTFDGDEEPPNYFPTLRTIIVLPKDKSVSKEDVLCERKVGFEEEDLSYYIDTYISIFEEDEYCNVKTELMNTESIK